MKVVGAEADGLTTVFAGSLLPLEQQCDLVGKCRAFERCCPPVGPWKRINTNVIYESRVTIRISCQIFFIQFSKIPIVSEIMIMLLLCNPEWAGLPEVETFM